MVTPSRAAMVRSVFTAFRWERALRPTPATHPRTGRKRKKKPAKGRRKVMAVVVPVGGLDRERLRYPACVSSSSTITILHS